MESEKKSNGALIGLIVIVIILIIGGIYVWMSSRNTANNPNVQIESMRTTDSAELNNLEQEVNAANTDAGANAIDSVQ